MGRPAAAAIPLGEAAVPKPLRADARRNRERILRSARAVFSEQGTEAQIDDIARRAKVGVGTVYRHFPTKEALVDALVRERFEEIALLADAALMRDDPWAAFADFVWATAEVNASDRGFCEAVADADKSTVVRECGLQDSTAELMRRAKAAGAMRPDASHHDVGVMMCGLCSVISTVTDAGAWRRYVTLFLDGLRAA